MNRTVLLLLLLALVVLVGVADLAWLYPQLPERVATKFDASGRAVGWSARGSLLALQLSLLIFVAVGMVGMRFGLRWVPLALINLPRRDYWLAPERAEHTYRVVGDLILGMGTGALAFFVAMQHWIMRANLQPEPRLERGFWILLFVFLALYLGVALRTWLYFWRAR